MANKTTEKTTKRHSSSAPPAPARAAAARSTNAPTPEQIAQRAFELFLARGGHHGHHEDDWLRAERELASRPS